MEEKLRRLMKHEGINSTRLAEILGIQASGISHIMSGRNKPSYDFLLKLLQRFPQINPDWLMLDKGPMYRDEVKASGRNGEPSRSAGAWQTTGQTTEQTIGWIGTATAKQASGHTAGQAALFSGPDNDDIIPLDGPEQRPRQSQQSQQSQFQSHQPRQPQNLQHPPQHQSPDHRQVDAPDVSAANVENFTRSSAVERIVVFYKDKTFTEYQPCATD